MNKLILVFLMVFFSQLAISQIRWEQIKPISAQMEKTTIVGNDIVLIEDSEASGLRKSIKISNLFTYIIDSINNKVSNEAYDEATWNGITTVAPSKDAVRDVIQNMTLAIYCADSMAVNRGTLNTGTVADLCAVGGTDVNISELTGADPLRVSFKFSNVERLNYFVFYGNYAGSASHIMWVEIYNPTANTWASLGVIATNATKQWYSLPIFQPNTYIASGVVRVRFSHQTNGVNSHNLILDYVDVNFGGAGGGSTIDASNVTVTANGNISSTNVQSALQELDSEKEPVLTKGDLTANVTGLQFDQTSQVIGGAAQLSLSLGYSIPTTASVIRSGNHVTNDLDTLITNEIQTLDTARINSNILELSLLNDTQAKKSISLKPYIDLQQTIPWGSSIVHDYNNGQDAYIFLTGNVNSYTLTNVPESGEGEIVIVQDGTGGWGVSNIILSGVATLYVDEIELTTTGSSGASTFVNRKLNVPTYTLSGLGGIGYTNLSSTATGLSYNNTNGVFSLTSGYTIPTLFNVNYWNSLDPSATNEGILGVAEVSTSTVRLTSNTNGASGSIFAAGRGMKVSAPIASTNGGRIEYRMGTPSTISGITTNLLSDTTHTHALNIYGTPSAGDVAGYDATYGLAWKTPASTSNFALLNGANVFTQNQTVTKSTPIINIKSSDATQRILNFQDSGGNVKGSVISDTDNSLSLKNSSTITLDAGSNNTFKVTGSSHFIGGLAPGYQSNTVVYNSVSGEITHQPTIIKGSTIQQWTTGTQTLNLLNYTNLYVDSITTNVVLTLNTITDGMRGSILIYKDTNTTYILTIYGNIDGSGNDMTALTPQGSGQNNLTAAATYYDQVDWYYYGGKLVAIKTTLVH